jgi:hypothetical protein
MKAGARRIDPRAGKPAEPAMPVDVAWACDTDHDRHGVVTGGAGRPWR